MGAQRGARTIVAVLGFAATAAAVAPMAVADARTAGVACPANSRPATVRDLPAKLRPYRDMEFIGDATLWTIAFRTPVYSARDHEWHVVKQPWFRAEEGPLTIHAHRVGARGGTFTLDMPPVESYPLWLNSPPGFIPSNLIFSKPGCWKLTARLGRSTVVLHVHVDGSKSAICADLAADRRGVQSYGTEDPSLADIAADERARGCPT